MVIQYWAMNHRLYGEETQNNQCLKTGISKMYSSEHICYYKSLSNKSVYIFDQLKNTIHNLKQSWSISI